MHWMYQNSGWSNVDFFGISTFPLVGFLPLLIWAIAWKGWALWLAARRGELVWFIVLLGVNTFGLLEIFYIFVIAKQKDQIDKVSAEY